MLPTADAKLLMPTHYTVLGKAAPRSTRSSRRSRSSPVLFRGDEPKSVTYTRVCRYRLQHADLLTPAHYNILGRAGPTLDTLLQKQKKLKDMHKDVTELTVAYNAHLGMSGARVHSVPIQRLRLQVCHWFIRSVWT